MISSAEWTRFVKLLGRLWPSMRQGHLFKDADVASTWKEQLERFDFETLSEGARRWNSVSPRPPEIAELSDAAARVIREKKKDEAIAARPPKMPPERYRACFVAAQIVYALIRLKSLDESRLDECFQYQLAQGTAACIEYRDALFAELRAAGKTPTFVGENIGGLVAGLAKGKTS